MTKSNLLNSVQNKQFGFKAAVQEKVDEIKNLYCSDMIPWVIGYSGGKDSTAVTQLIWIALSQLQKTKRKKTVYVISTDTLVENPVVALWVQNSLNKMEDSANENGLPIATFNLTPDIKDTFWVNLIGRGYPAPRPRFRWCTERMKINPSNTFIKQTVAEHNEAIVVLGTRKAESSERAARINRLQKNSIREHLIPHTTMPNAFVYAPISEWSNDDVWLFLMQFANPWGYNNKDLLTMYQGASTDGECPLVVDTTTPSCGNSRFGCWVCTMVEQDKSMTAMIQNDEEKRWMEPLLALRNELDKPDHKKRDFRRMAGHVQLFDSRKNLQGVKTVPGPYTQEYRGIWLRKLLEAQKFIQDNPNTPKDVKDIELIKEQELHEIRRIWILEKHEIEDLLPKIYFEVFGKQFRVQMLDDSQPFDDAVMHILGEVCEGNDLHFEMMRNLLDVERRYRSMLKRTNLFKKIDDVIKRTFYEDASDAVNWVTRKAEWRDEIVDSYRRLDRESTTNKRTGDHHEVSESST
ncbi:MAG: DNA phosphorothioation system sulfurtransferase DndC [Acidiferrobacterales bacterium]|nr:DNA phosphorothioation system sulfurtransferase DndC [Acidiferrobacterales bacterium]